jgi:hypothetical protein
MTTSPDLDVERDALLAVLVETTGAHGEDLALLTASPWHRCPG